MIRTVSLIAVFLSVGCARDGASDFATYSCANGPDLAVAYGEEAATVTLGTGKSQTLPKADDGVYAKDGIVFQTTGFRTARYTTPSTSFHCDQMQG